MKDYAMKLLKKKLEEKMDRIEDCQWWIRTIVFLLHEEKYCRKKNPANIEAYQQRLRSFLDGKKGFQEDAASLRAALTKLRRSE